MNYFTKRNKKVYFLNRNMQSTKKQVMPKFPTNFADYRIQPTYSGNGCYQVSYNGDWHQEILECFPERDHVNVGHHLVFIDIPEAEYQQFAAQLKRVVRDL